VSHKTPSQLHCCLDANPPILPRTSNWSLVSSGRCEPLPGRCEPLPQITNITISLLFSRIILVRSANSSYLPHFFSHIYPLSCEPSSSHAKLWCYRILWRKLVVIEAIRTTHHRQIDTLKWTVDT